MVFIATRRIVRPPKKGSVAQRPRSRTLTAVHDAMLEDVVHPAEIVGKRVRYRLDGSKIIKVNSKLFCIAKHKCFFDPCLLFICMLCRFSWTQRLATTQSTSWRHSVECTGSFPGKMLFLSTLLQKLERIHVS